MAYNKTIYSNDSPPALNAENLNNNENEVESLDFATNEITEKTTNIADIRNLKIGVSWNNSINADRACLTIPVNPGTRYNFNVWNGSFTQINWVEKESAAETASTQSVRVDEFPYHNTTKNNTGVLVIMFTKTNISADDFNGVSIMVSTGNVLTYVPSLSAIDVTSRNTLPNKIDNSKVADSFRTDVRYLAGQYVYYNNKLYRFTAEHNKTAWTGSDVVEVVVLNEGYSANNNIDGILFAENTFYSGIARTDNLFTSSDISEGEILSYKFLALANTGYISFYDSNNTVIENLGKTSSSVIRSYFSGEYTIPTGFSYAKANGRIMVGYLAKGRTEESLLDEEEQMDVFHNFVKRKPRVTIIDDDGQTAFYTLLLPLINQYHVPIVSAFSADKNGWWQPDSSYMTIEQLREIEAAGGEIITHGQYNLTELTLEQAEANVVLSKSNLKSLGFKDYDYYVYPTGSSNEEVRSMISKHFKCALCTYDKAASLNNRTNSRCIGSYFIKRCHCGGANYDPVANYGRYAGLDTSLMEYFEELINEAIEKNSWLVLYTHSFAMASGQAPTDGATQIERLAEIIEYIIDLRDNQGIDIDIVSVRDAFDMFGNAMEAGDYLGEEFNEDLTKHSHAGSAINKLGEYDLPTSNNLNS